MGIRFIDLFAGIGGIRIGMEQAGFHCVMSSEINEECRKTYFMNFHETPLGDIYKISTSDIPGHDILCAGFPCQPFSISGKQKGFEDERGNLFFEICRVIESKFPAVVFLENVKHLVYHNGGHTLSTILNKLAGFGYKVSWEVLNASDFMVPQNRERIIIVASKTGKFDFSRVHKHEKVRMLEFLDKNGNFEYLDKSTYTLIDNPRLQPVSGLMFAGYRNKSIRKVGVREGTENLSRVHKQPNRIYSVQGVHPTLPSQETSGRYFILTDDNRVRKLTLNECWRFMGFPNTYKKISPATEQYKQVGNSVCVPMIFELAKEIRSQFFE